MDKIGVAAAALLALVSGQAMAADAIGQRVTLGYELYAASLPAASLDIVLERTGSSYRIDGDLRTVGLAELRVGWRARQVSTGRLVDGEVEPAHYSNHGEWRDHPRIAILKYGSVTGLDVELTPTAAAEQRPAVETGMRHGTVDFMSAMVEMAFAPSPEAACSGTVEIFDGRRRYDMTLIAGRLENLPAKPVSMYAGEALRCAVTVRRIAGFPAGGDGFDIPEKAYLWLAREARSGLVLPVRIQAPTEYGMADIYLARLAVNDERQAAVRSK